MPNSPLSKLNGNLRLRVLSALVMIPIVLLAVWAGGAAVMALVAAAMVLGLREWLALTAPRLSLRGRVWAYAALGLLLILALGKGMGQAALMALFAGGILAFYAGQAERSSAGWRRGALWCGAGVPYIVWSGLALIALRNNASHGLVLLVYLLLVVWGTDTGGYLAGRLIGGPKLCPSISPKKTWAGLFGGMALAALLGYGALAGFGFAPAIAAPALAAALAVIAQAGDFFESYVKRRAGAKDSGTLIPGHGGLLDRVDGLFAAGIALALIVQFWGVEWLWQ